MLRDMRATGACWCQCLCGCAYCITVSLFPSCVLFRICGMVSSWYPILTAQHHYCVIALLRVHIVLHCLAFDQTVLTSFHRGGLPRTPPHHQHKPHHSTPLTHATSRHTRELTLHRHPTTHHAAACPALPTRVKRAFLRTHPAAACSAPHQCYSLRPDSQRRPDGREPPASMCEKSC